MTHLGIRDLQKLSADTLRGLDGPVSVKSGSEIVGLLIPVRPVDPARAEAALEAARDRLAREPAADAAFLRNNPDIDPTVWPEPLPNAANLASPGVAEQG
jgi:hypothetical protein